MPLIMQSEIDLHTGLEVKKPHSVSSIQLNQDPINVPSVASVPTDALIK